MIGGMRYSNDDIIYTMFKKHYCPDCNQRLKRIKEVKIIDAKSPEAKKYDLGNECRLGDLKLILVEFICPKCQKHYSIAKMKEIECKCGSDESADCLDAVDVTEASSTSETVSDATVSETIEVTVE